MELKPVVAIIGPTAVGKSKVSILLAKRIGGEIISCDSMQFYRGMDIGTAKIPHSEREGVPHHMLDILNPDETFSVAEFAQKTETLISSIHNNNRIPILVGGSGLYFRSVIDHYQFSEIPTDPKVRARLEAEVKNEGLNTLFQKLKDIDPVAARKIHPHDQRRIIRAMEVFALTGLPISSFYRLENNNTPKYKLALVGLTMEREKLYARIDARVDAMIREGLVEEVSKLLARGYSPQLPAMQGLGYKQIVGYLSDEYDLQEAIRLIKRDTRHFAKRQLTWFKRDSRIHWLNVETLQPTEEIVAKITHLIGRTIGRPVE